MTPLVILERTAKELISTPVLKDRTAAIADLAWLKADTDVWNNDTIKIAMSNMLNHSTSRTDKKTQKFCR